MPYKKGDLCKVMSPFAPYWRREVVVDVIEEGQAWPVVCNIAIDGQVFPVAYREHEIELVDTTSATEEIPVVIV